MWCGDVYRVEAKYNMPLRVYICSCGVGAEYLEKWENLPDPLKDRLQDLIDKATKEEDGNRNYLPE